MVWISILREMGAAYNAYDYNFDADEDNGSSEMDPIPEGYAGCLDQKALHTAAKELGAPILIFGTQVLQSGRSFHAATRPVSREPTRHFRTHTLSRFITALWILWTWDILTPANHEEIVRFAVFFTVAKANGRQRTIMDCRGLNAASERPPPVNLGQMGETLSKAAELGCTHHIQADISHWFHLFSLPEEVRRFFGVQCYDKEWSCTAYFKSCTMPMGWSWAPFVAQCTTITAVLSLAHTSRRKTQPYLGIDYEEVKTWNSLPPYIELFDTSGKVVGFIKIVYDNIGIFLSDATLARSWKEQLLSCGPKFNVKWKEMYVLDSRGVFDVLHNSPVMRSDDPTSRSHELTFLGAEIQTASSDHPFRWRHDQKKIHKWQRVFAKVPTTAKDVSKIVGVLVWDCIIHLMPFAAITEQIDGLRVVSGLVEKKSDWDRPLTVQTLRVIQEIFSLERLQSMYAQISLNPWYYGHHDPNRRTFFMASDATEQSIAGVLLNESGRVVTHFAKLNLRPTHIYTKEVLAIYATVLFVQRVRGSDEAAVFRIAVDNKAAAAACMRCYSTCSGMNRILLKLWEFMERHNIKLQCVDIHTKLNIADLPSRRKPLTRRLANATMSVLTGRIPGRPDWLYTSDTVESDYLPLISEFPELPEDLVDETENVWVSVRNLRRWKESDVEQTTEVRKRVR